MLRSNATCSARPSLTALYKVYKTVTFVTGSTLSPIPMLYFSPSDTPKSIFTHVYVSCPPLPSKTSTLRGQAFFPWSFIAVSLRLEVCPLQSSCSIARCSVMRSNTSTNTAHSVTSRWSRNQRDCETELCSETRACFPSPLCLSFLLCERPHGATLNRAVHLKSMATVCPAHQSWQRPQKPA